VRAAFGWLEREQVADNAAAVGYCLGGRVAFLANSVVPLRPAASY
jgi:carboxymethylenebutenolidase